MNGKHVFGQIDTHGNNGHGASPPVVVMAFAGALQLRRELGTQLLQLPLERLDLALALLVAFAAAWALALGLQLSL